MDNIYNTKDILDLLQITERLGNEVGKSRNIGLSDHERAAILGATLGEFVGRSLIAQGYTGKEIKDVANRVKSIDSLNDLQHIVLMLGLGLGIITKMSIDASIGDRELLLSLVDMIEKELKTGLV